MRPLSMARMMWLRGFGGLQETAVFLAVIAISSRLVDKKKVVRPGRFERPATGVEIRRSIRAELQALMNRAGGDGQIRTDVCLTQADLQSAPFDHLGTPPEISW
jgi:hypothetical protein